MKGSGVIIDVVTVVAVVAVVVGGRDWEETQVLVVVVPVSPSRLLSFISSLRLMLL